MGVPKFYRWLSERYPCLSEVVKEYQIPEFDNLYLDMNGIIHICSHPNDDDPHFRISEEKIFQDIFHYIEFLFRMVQPRKVFFMAVDGVAPRAKMNQQRGRRFRSAKEAELNEKKARDRGEKLPDEVRFDSNCITPGTPFMVRLQDQLKYFVANKVSSDGLWKNCRVILSGHETPGEGEHKIMDFIRYEKSLPGYDPNTRHCLYGLDADLIMLGLCSHDPHFSLLREEVKFGGKKSQGGNKRIPTPEETTFHLLHLSLMREYLDYEFQDLKKLDFYDLEHIIDDWVLMGFLVGNDFIPHLPNMHINKGALPELYGTYKAVLPKLGGYINEGGQLNLKRFEIFLKKLSESELEKFDDIYSDAKWLEGKTAKKTESGRTVVAETAGPSNVYELLEGHQEPWIHVGKKGQKPSSDLQKLMASTAEFDSPDEDDGLDAGDDESRGDFYQMEFRQHKRDYYTHKLGYSQVTPAVLREQAEGYVRAIQWNLHYYYNGCVSWSWFYPHHYSPWITDIKDFSSMDLSFDKGKPFLPFEQLLAVLPLASKECIPKPLQWLMMAKESPIIDFYPTEFEQDLNGKQQEWEAVVVIPFIDETRLLEAITPIYPRLSQEESERNSHGPMWIGTYSSVDQGQYQAPAFFPTIDKSHCKLDRVFRDEWDVPIDKLKKGLMPGAKLDVFFPGFPTLKHIRHVASLNKSSVRVFEQASRGENMILSLFDQGRPDVSEVAQALIGSEVWVSWPHLVEAKVIAVQSSNAYYDSTGERSEPPRNNSNDGQQSFGKLANTIKTNYSNRYGVEIGDVNILVHALPMSGRKYVMAATKGRITLEKQWHNIAQPFALQAIVKDILVEDPGLKTYCTVEELFPQGSDAFMLGQPHYGAQGKVLKIDPEHKGRIQLKFIISPEPELSGVMSKHSRTGESYMPGYRAAQRCGVSGHVVARITGTIFVVRGAREQTPDSASKTNIGLNLKFGKRGEEVCGYTRRQGSDDGQWLYSMATVDIINQYQRHFPEVFDYVCSGNQSSNDMFHELDVFGEDNLERMGELIKWLENLPSAAALRQPYGTQTLEESIIKDLEEVTSSRTGDSKEVVMQVKPHLLYLPNHLAGCALVEPGTVFCLYDRVVNVREGFSVPLGLRGTVIRIQKGVRVEDNVYDVLFDEVFTGGLNLRCTPGRGYRMPGSAMINLTFKESGGKRVKKQESEKMKPQAVVRPLVQQENSDQNTAPRQNPWQNRNRHQQTNNVKPQKRTEPEKEKSPAPAGGFPPPPQVLPNPAALFKQKTPPTQTEQPKFTIMSRSEAGKNGNLENIWQSLGGGGGAVSVAGGGQQKPVQPQPEADATAGVIDVDTSTTETSSSAVSDMSDTLKSMLKITADNTAAGEKPKFVVGGDQGTVSDQSYCRILMNQLTSRGQGQPRYDTITDPGTGLLAAQVTLEDGTMYHSPHPCGDREHACEMAAQVALQSLGIIANIRLGPGGHRGHRGRGRGHRGGRGRGSENQFQPWAEYSGGHAGVRHHQQSKNHRYDLSGTDQMDIRYRDKDESKQETRVKPAFVPLQVRRQAVKSSKEIEIKKDVSSTVVEAASAVTKEDSSNESVKSREVKQSHSKESTPQRNVKSGKNQQKSERKMRMAANFGE